MIVDLLRNDLGKVARFGKVLVPELFRIERHATVHQMVSAIGAEVAPETGLPELFAALFPCGSVTGAPKVAATRVIAALESTPRDVYCGAIGVIAPGGDCAFNVAIRTAVADAERGTLTYGIGGGVTWASTAAGEWREAVGKAAILHPARPAAALLETFRVEGREPVRWAEHRRRLLASADVLGHRIRAADLDDAVAEAAVSCGAETRIVRLTADADGGVRWETRPLVSTGVLSAALARDPIDPADPRLYHKTTDRSLYEAAGAGLGRGVEPLLWNRSGNLTEFARGNLVADLGGRLVTPPIHAGLLPGVYRDELVRTGRVDESEVAVSDLESASGVWLVNSAREWASVRNPVAAPGVG